MKTIVKHYVSDCQETQLFLSEGYEILQFYAIRHHCYMVTLQDMTKSSVPLVIERAYEGSSASNFGRFLGSIKRPDVYSPVLFFEKYHDRESQEVSEGARGATSG